MPVDTLSRPLQVLSTRVYESGPSGPIVKPEKLATSKQEEWLTSRKKEELVTKQIETRVRREILVDEDGQIIDTSDPNITTSTTEDVKVDETETTEHKTTGSDSPGDGWMLVPGSKVVNEKILKKKTNHVVRDEKTEGEETEGLPALSQEEFNRILDARRRHHAISDYTRSDSPLGNRALPVSETLVETEEVREVSQALGDIVLGTDRSRLASRERSSSPFPGDNFDNPPPPARATRRGAGKAAASAQRPRFSPPSPPLVTSVRVTSPSSNPSPKTNGTWTTTTKNPSATHNGSSSSNNNTTTTTGKHKQTDTSRWIENHFGEYPESPTRVTTVLRDIPSPVRVNSSNNNNDTGCTVVQRSSDEPTGPNNFSAIKDFFQSAVEKTENYYSEKNNNTLTRRDRTNKSSGSSSSKSNGNGNNGNGYHHSPTTTTTPRAATKQNSWPTSTRNGGGGVYVGDGAKPDDEFARGLRRQGSLEEHRSPSASKNHLSHDDYSKYSSLQRERGPTRAKALFESDQELDVQRIINSFRSPYMKHATPSPPFSPSPRIRSPQPQPHAPTTIPSRVTPTGKNVITINVGSTHSLSNDSASGRRFGFLDENDYRPLSPNPLMSNGASPSQKVRVRVNNGRGVGGSNLLSKSSLNRSTPSLHNGRSPLASPIPDSCAPSGRSVSSLAINHVGSNGVAGNHHYHLHNNNSSSNPPFGRKLRNKSGSSNVWIGSDTDVRRQTFMQGLLSSNKENGERTATYSNSTSPSPPAGPSPTPTAPPRRHHRAAANPRSSVSPQPQTFRRTVSPEPAPSSPKPFYYMGESEVPPRSDSPVTRTEKTTKRRVTTTKTRVDDAEPYANHYAKTPTSGKEPRSRQRRH